jgi:hypothetical protein
MSFNIYAPIDLKIKDKLDELTHVARLQDIIPNVKIGTLHSNMH